MRSWNLKLRNLDSFSVAQKVETVNVPEEQVEVPAEKVEQVEPEKVEEVKTTILLSTDKKEVEKVQKKKKK